LFKQQALFKMPKWYNPTNHQIRTEPYVNITHARVQQKDPMQQIQPTIPDYHRPHEGGSSQTDICDDGDGVPDWPLVDRLIKEKNSAYDELHKLAQQKWNADIRIQNLIQEKEAVNERRSKLSKNNEVLQDLVKTLKLPESKDSMDTKRQISKLRRDLKVTKAQLRYHSKQPYSSHAHELQEAEQRLLLANSKVRMLEGYLYGQPLESDSQQAVGVKKVRERSNSF
jgi:hypothetical protein